MLRGGGLRAGQKPARLATNRTHIKRAFTVSIAIATYVHYAYRNRRATTYSAPLVVVSKKEKFLWQRGLFGKAS